MIIFQILPAFFLINKPRSHLFAEITALSFKKSFQLKSNKVQHLKWAVLLQISVVAGKIRKWNQEEIQNVLKGRFPHHPPP